MHFFLEENKQTPTAHNSKHLISTTEVMRRFTVSTLLSNFHFTKTDVLGNTESRMLPLGISAFRHLPEQICTIFLSAGLLIDWLFVKYLQLCFLRCFSSNEYWKTLKTYWIVHVSSESGMTAAKGFVHSDYFIVIIIRIILFLFITLFFAWEEFWNCEW